MVKLGKKLGNINAHIANAKVMNKLVVRKKWTNSIYHSGKGLFDAIFLGRNASAFYLSIQIREYCISVTLKAG